MSIFTKKVVDTPVITADSLAGQLSAKLEQNATRLDNQKNRALSSFRRTVVDLRHVNMSLQADVKLAEQMIAACEKRKAEAEQAIKDNEAVCQGIINIIGEVPDAACVDENCDGTCDTCPCEGGQEG